MTTASAKAGMKAQLASLPAALLLLLAANEAQALCTFGGSPEPPLQSQVDLIMGGPGINVQTDCLADGTDALWETVNQLGMVTIRVELARNAATNTFGIYDPLNQNLIRIFEGGDRAGDFGLVQVWEDSGQWYAQTFDSRYNGSGSGDVQGWGAAQLLSSSAFGFYLGTLGNGTFFSETSENADGLDHLYAYGPVDNKPFDYIIAWEDLINGQDRDYQDFVATLVDITPVPVPLPAAVWLLATGLLGLAGVARSRTP